MFDFNSLAPIVPDGSQACSGISESFSMAGADQLCTVGGRKTVEKVILVFIKWEVPVGHAPRVGLVYLIVFKVFGFFDTFLYTSLLPDIGTNHSDTFHFFPLLYEGAQKEKLSVRICSCLG